MSSINRSRQMIFSSWGQLFSSLESDLDMASFHIQTSQFHFLSRQMITAGMTSRSPHNITTVPSSTFELDTRSVKLATSSWSTAFSLPFLLDTLARQPCSLNLRQRVLIRESLHGSDPYSDLLATSRPQATTLVNWSMSSRTLGSSFDLRWRVLMKIKSIYYIWRTISWSSVSI